MPQNYNFQIANAFNHVRYAAAVAEYQAIFRGVKLELKDNHTRAIATDGFRLAYYHSTESTGLEGDMVIPARSVEELARILVDTINSTSNLWKVTSQITVVLFLTSLW